MEGTPFATNIVFMGTPDFAVPSLEMLIAHQYPIHAVVTAPDKPRGRGRHLAPTPIKRVALKHQLPILQPESLKDPSFIEAIKGFHPDIVVVVAFRILPKDIFTIPRHGSFNLHASLLPKYRGAAPINWALINGETETGVSTFFLKEKVDTGSILLQARMPVMPDDDAGSLHDKLAEIGAEIVLHTVRLIEQGKAVPRMQDDALASPAPKIFREVCRINWNAPAKRIHNLVRGLSPYPAAFTIHSGKLIKIFRTAVSARSASSLPGVIEVVGETLEVSTSDTCLTILELQQEGKKRMSIGEFLRGYRIGTGERFA